MPSGSRPLDGSSRISVARVAEQRRGDAEPLAHAERERPDALARDVLQPDELDHLVDAAARDAVRLGQRQQVVVGRAPGVDRAGLEHRADLVQRRARGRGRPCR